MRLTQTRRPSSRPLMVSLVVLTGCLALATPTMAQQRISTQGDGRTPGMRYLTWPGKAGHPRDQPAVTPPVPMAEVRADEAPDRRVDRVEASDGRPARGPILTMPSQPLVAPVATRYSARTSPGPTPASAWVSNGRLPTEAGTPYFPSSYDPTPTAAYAAPPPLDTAANARVAILPEPPRDYPPVLPLDTPVREVPADVPVPYTIPLSDAPARDALMEAAPAARGVPVAADTGPAAPPAAPAVDPYAPRADAPIFRMLNRNSQPAPVPEGITASSPGSAPATAAAAGTPQAAPRPYPASAVDADRSPRRYSVHRANGQSPDRVPLPDPVLLDSAPVDLAEPPEAPTVVRNINGRLTAITPASEDPAQP